MKGWLLWAVVLGWPLAGLSQTNTNAPVTVSRMSLWNCKFSDGSYYSVSLGAIDSVSQHEYLLDGTLRVVEVTVATRGSTQTRFYVLEKPSADTGALPGQSLAARAPGAAKTATNSVVKKFPETTHAKVIEYRIANRETLGKLFDHLLKRWQGRSADDTFEVTN
jgi:hypothetical protein